MFESRRESKGSGTGCVIVAVNGYRRAEIHLLLLVPMAITCLCLNATSCMSRTHAERPEHGRMPANWTGGSTHAGNKGDRDTSVSSAKARRRARRVPLQGGQAKTG
ncbi:hypothetical protein PV04_06884 [Phialophora macrospora]|uniref:Uncharacterized protein n=1 Tax=Phialophora macrospora TaxID=1851006 RepID=A0A0D2FHY0_9EURO|nr:hypothetical protein PV04_06884 [Phialophora macrospora]